MIFVSGNLHAKSAAKLLHFYGEIKEKEIFSFQQPAGSFPK